MIETETNSRFDGDVVERYLTYQTVFSKAGKDYVPDDGNSNFTIGENQPTLVQTDLGIMSTAPVELGELIFPSDPSGRVQRTGVIKTFQRSKEYLYYMDQALRNKWLKLYDKFSTPNPKLPSHVIRDECLKELKWFVWPDTDDKNMRYKSGKITGKIGGRNDDNAIAILMIMFYARIRDAQKENVDKWASAIM